MIHPPDVIGKHAPDAVIGVVGTGAPAGAVGGAAKGGKSGAPARKDKGGELANHHAWGHKDGASNWRLEAMDDFPDALLINVKAYFNEKLQETRRTTWTEDGWQNLQLPGCATREGQHGTWRCP